MAIYVRSGDQFGVDIVLDDEETQEMLQRMIDWGHNIGPVLKKVQIYMLKSTAETFRVQGRPQRWAPLSKRTIAMRRKGRKGQGVIGGKPQILRDRGILLASVSARSAKGAIRTIADNVMILGTRLSYAIKQQLGDPGRRKVTQKVKAHKRRKHTRGATLFMGFARPVVVRAHRVRAHIRHVVFGPTPARPFLMWREEDIQEIRHIVADELMRAAEG